MHRTEKLSDLTAVWIMADLVDKWVFPVEKITYIRVEKKKRDHLSCRDVNLFQNSWKDIKQSRRTGHEAIPAGIYSVITPGTFPLKLPREKISPTSQKYPSGVRVWEVGVGLRFPEMSIGGAVCWRTLVGGSLLQPWVIYMPAYKEHTGKTNLKVFRSQELLPFTFLAFKIENISLNSSDFSWNITTLFLKSLF